MMRIVVAFAVVIALGFFLAACSRAKEKTGSLQQGFADFTLEKISGGEIALNEVLKEKNVVLLFWATWCPYCRTELPRAEQFYQKNKAQVEVIAVDVAESREKVNDFLKKINISYPVVLDSLSQVARAHKLVGVPTIVALNKSGQTLYYGHSIAEMAEKVKF